MRNGHALFWGWLESGAPPPVQAARGVASEVFGREGRRAAPSLFCTLIVPFARCKSGTPDNGLRLAGCFSRFSDGMYNGSAATMALDLSAGMPFCPPTHSQHTAPRTGKRFARQRNSRFGKFLLTEVLQGRSAPVACSRNSSGVSASCARNKKKLRWNSLLGIPPQFVCSPRKGIFISVF